MIQPIGQRRRPVRPRFVAAAAAGFASVPGQAGAAPRRGPGVAVAAVAIGLVAALIAGAAIPPTAAASPAASASRGGSAVGPEIGRADGGGSNRAWTLAGPSDPVALALARASAPSALSAASTARLRTGRVDRQVAPADPGRPPRRRQDAESRLRRVRGRTGRGRGEAPAAQPAFFDEILTLAEAAELSGLSAHTLTQQAEKGRLQARKIGRIWVTTRQWLGVYQANYARRRRNEPAGAGGETA